MVEVRGLLRGIAWHTGSGPAEVLRGVDAAIEGLQVATTATAIVARLEQTPSERDLGATRLRWSNAGHPPPMAVDAAGNVVILPGSEVDLLLGFEPRTSRIQFEITLDQGATVLLYTDGLIERRGEDLDTGLARLRDTPQGASPSAARPASRWRVRLEVGDLLNEPLVAAFIRCA